MATNYRQLGAGFTYAGFWLRFAAYLIDTSILLILSLAIGIGSEFTGDEMIIMIGYIALLLINLLYWPVMESSSRQATFGKSMVGIDVTDKDGKRLTFLRALLRNLAKIISALPLCIGFLMAGFTGRKQALHDLITQCVVVRIRPSRIFKAFAAAILALAIAIGSSGAYFYYVIMPMAQDEFGNELKAAMLESMSQFQETPPVVTPADSVRPPAVIPAAPVSAPVAASAPIATSSPAPPAPIPEPAPAMQPSEPAPVVVAEPAPAPAKAAPTTRKAAPKKIAKKEVKKPVTAPELEKTRETVKMLDPMDSHAAAPGPGLSATPPPVTESLPMPKAIVTYAPDSESRIIRPKYNDVMTAVLRRDQEAVKQMLDLGWWVDKPGPDGFTPLVAAVMNRDTQMVKLLLDHGAAPSIQALKVARGMKDGATATLLEQYGAR